MPRHVLLEIPVRIALRSRGAPIQFGPVFLMRRSKGHGLRAQRGHVWPWRRQGHRLKLPLPRQAVGEAVVHVAQLGTCWFLLPGPPMTAPLTNVPLGLALKGTRIVHAIVTCFRPRVTAGMHEAPIFGPRHLAELPFARGTKGRRRHNCCRTRCLVEGWLQRGAGGVQLRRGRQTEPGGTRGAKGGGGHGGRFLRQTKAVQGRLG
mmetsp:Transcript_23300/g.50736  ORF Transcript_23300/g.50736 Transcript_23300/m.50736 type:complete len:205 (-) Transcript_23300:95-709(-)